MFRFARKPDSSKSQSLEHSIVKFFPNILDDIFARHFYKTILTRNCFWGIFLKNFSIIVLELSL